MKKQIVKIVSYFMFVVFLAGVMPKEYLHELFYDHQDDVHPIHGKNDLIFTPKHNHCSFVGFAFAPFIATEKQFISFREPFPIYVRYVHPLYHYCYLTSFHSVSLRGPPVC